MPKFITKPKSQSVISGSDLLIRCQATGDPHPDIIWKKEGGQSDIDIDKVKIVHGKGLRITNVHPSDGGTYICKAKNLAGSIVAKATLKVLEPPVISVKPEASVRVVEGRSEPVVLDCLVTGNPLPLIYWTKEEALGGTSSVLYPGTKTRNVRVNLDGSLQIDYPRVSDSGHYSCSTINEVGSSIARSHLMVGSSTEIEAIIEDIDDFAQTEARLATQETGLRIKNLGAQSPNSLKVVWDQLFSARRYLTGFRIWYKPASASVFESIQVDHPDTTTFILNHLEENTKYDVFVQPFYRGVVGRPSELKSAKTLESAPSAAPVIVEAQVVNSTTIYLAWETLPEVHRNGELTGYQVRLLSQFIK